MLCGISAATSLLSVLPAEASSSALASQHLDVREVYSIASNDDFWGNLTQYARFFVSVLVRPTYKREGGSALRENMIVHLDVDLWTASVRP